MEYYIVGKEKDRKIYRSPTTFFLLEIGPEVNVYPVDTFTYDQNGKFMEIRYNGLALSARSLFNVRRIYLKNRMFKTFYKVMRGNDVIGIISEEIVGERSAFSVIKIEPQSKLDTVPKDYVMCIHLDDVSVR